MAPRARRETAYHEAGHAVAAFHHPLAGRTTRVTMTAEHLSDYNADTHAVNHAAGLHYRGHTLRSVTGRQVDREQLHHELMMLLCGPAAGWVFAGEHRWKRKGTRAEIDELRRKHEGRDDHSQALKLLDAADPFDHQVVLEQAATRFVGPVSEEVLTEKLFRPAMDAHTQRLLDALEANWREALAFAAAHWPAVQAVADALWRKRSLTGDEVAEIIEGAEARTQEPPGWLTESLETVLCEREGRRT